MNSKHILEKLFEKKDLSSREIQLLLKGCVEDELSDAQITAFLVALRTKGETVEEITGLIKGMRQYMIHFSDAVHAVDTCGTGGDGMGTFNISTTVALVVAGAGVPVVKHGNRASSSLCGSADVLAELGVNIMLTPKQAENVFKNLGIIFLFAPLYHPAMKRIAPIRKALGTRTVFNFIGPFLNPAQVKRQIIGVPNVQLAEKLAQVASQLNYEHVLIVTSENGMDEITINGTSSLYAIKGTNITKKQLNPQTFGFKKVSNGTLRGGNVVQNAACIGEVLHGTKNAKRDIVVLNSAYALFVAGRVDTIEKGIAIAEASIDSGAALKVLQDLIKETQKYASKN